MPNTPSFRVGDHLQVLHRDPTGSLLRIAQITDVDPSADWPGYPWRVTFQGTHGDAITYLDESGEDRIGHARLTVMAIPGDENRTPATRRAAALIRDASASGLPGGLISYAAAAAEGLHRAEVLWNWPCGRPRYQVAVTTDGDTSTYWVKAWTDTFAARAYLSEETGTAITALAALRQAARELPCICDHPRRRPTTV